MGAYDRAKFSKQFSQRTEENLEHIQMAVKKEALLFEENKVFLDELQKAIDLVNALVIDIRKEASEISKSPQKGKIEVKQKLYSVAKKIECSKEVLKSSLGNLVFTDKYAGQELYEVTQLLNSLMGIAVLPYEMHKQYFKLPVTENEQQKVIEQQRLRERQNTLKHNTYYQELLAFIMTLYREKKWNTTFYYDKKKDRINEDTIVFQFLSHLRNAVCHGGDNAMSVLPLDDGTVIEEIVFYDCYKDQEFAMRLSVDEISVLVAKVAAFYKYSPLGNIDTTDNIEVAEEKAKKLLAKM
jgi:hypothetical protein